MLSPLDLYALLGLYGLVQAVRVAPAGHETPGEVVYDDHLAVPDHVLLVSTVQLHGPEGVLYVLDVVAGGVQVVHVKQPLHLLHARGRQADRAALFVYLIVLLLEATRMAGELGVELCGFLRGAADDQRGPCLVYEDVVHLVHYGVVQLTLDLPGHIHHHVVTQVVEAELVVGAVRDVRGVGASPIDVPHQGQGVVFTLMIGVVQVRGLMLKAADAEAQEVVDGAHPLRVSPRQVVVHRHYVYAPPRQSVEVDRKGRHQGLALSSLHLGDLALVERYAPHELLVEVPLPNDAPSGLSHRGECLRQQVVQLLPVLERRFELLGLGLEGVIGQPLPLGFQVAYLPHQGLEPGYGLFVGIGKKAEDFAKHSQDPYLLEHRSHG